jgi:hypothetical protein
VVTQGGQSTPLVKQAFVLGYSIFHDCPSEHAREALRSLLEIETDSRHLLHLAEQTGEKEALHDRLYMRKDHLDRIAGVTIRRWCDELSTVVDVKELSREAALAYQNAQPPTPANQVQAVKRTIVAFLMLALATNQSLTDEINTMLAELNSQAQAEGAVAAAAMLAHQYGQKLPDLGQVYKTVVGQQARSRSNRPTISPAVRLMIGGLAGDIGSATVQHHQTGTLTKSVYTTLRQGTGATFYGLNALHASYIGAVVIGLKTAGVSRVEFLTVGDDRVCPTCLSIEAGNPYQITEVPQPPIHGSCRCWISPA